MSEFMTEAKACAIGRHLLTLCYSLKQMLEVGFECYSKSWSVSNDYGLLTLISKRSVVIALPTKT